MYIEYFQIVLFFQLNMYWRKKYILGLYGLVLYGHLFILFGHVFFFFKSVKGSLLGIESCYSVNVRYS